MDSAFQRMKGFNPSPAQNGAQLNPLQVPVHRAWDRRLGPLKGSSRWSLLFWRPHARTQKHDLASLAKFKGLSPALQSGPLVLWKENAWPCGQTHRGYPGSAPPSSVPQPTIQQTELMQAWGSVRSSSNRDQCILQWSQVNIHEARFRKVTWRHGWLSFLEACTQKKDHSSKCISEGALGLADIHSSLGWKQGKPTPCPESRMKTRDCWGIHKGPQGIIDEPSSCHCCIDDNGTPATGVGLPARV